METLSQLKAEAEEVLRNNILSFWLGQMVDRENGGFYGQMRGDGSLVPQANKGGILAGRILWSFSAAYRVLGNSEYLRGATRARDYILSYFIDPQYGGTYWEVDCMGRPVNTKKQFYCLGFMIYGLSEYARATGDQAALDAAVRLFQTIEEQAWEPQYGGYIEAKTRDWQPISDMRLSDKDANYPKSQNTHLHIIEPYANLYRTLRERPSLRVAPSVRQALEGALRRLIDIFCTKILNPSTHHLDLFFENDWTRGAGWLESYGHDIECSWLLHEAALVLGDGEVLSRVEPVVRQVAKASEKGLNPDGSMTHEANLDTGRVDADRHWWVQAETVVGFLNIYQHFGDEAALQKALRCWNYIKENLIDYEGGEWWWSRDAQGRINYAEDKAGFWKCPYHNSRMCLEIIERLSLA